MKTRCDEKFKASLSVTDVQKCSTSLNKLRRCIENNFSPEIHVEAVFLWRAIGKNLTRAQNARPWNKTGTRSWDKKWEGRREKQSCKREEAIGCFNILIAGPPLWEQICAVQIQHPTSCSHHWSCYFSQHVIERKRRREREGDKKGRGEREREREGERDCIRRQM